MNNLCFNHRNYDIQFNPTRPKICSSFLLCWGLEYMELKNLVLLQLHIASPLLEEVYCIHQETGLCDECHHLLKLWPSYSHKHISGGTVRYSFFHCISAFYLIQFFKICWHCIPSTAGEVFHCSEMNRMLLLLLRMLYVQLFHSV